MPATSSPALRRLRGATAGTLAAAALGVGYLAVHLASDHTTDATAQGTTVGQPASFQQPDQTQQDQTQPDQTQQQAPAQPPQGQQGFGPVSGPGGGQGGTPGGSTHGS